MSEFNNDWHSELGAPRNIEGLACSMWERLSFLERENDKRNERNIKLAEENLALMKKIGNLERDIKLLEEVVETAAGS